MNKEKEEFEDILTRIKATFGLREGTLIIFLIGVISVRAMGLLSFVKPEQLNWVIFSLIVWLISNFIFRFLVEKQNTASGLNNLYLSYDILVELPLMSLMFYNIGGVEWMGAIFYLFPIVFTNIIFSKKRALLVCSAVSIYYSLVVLLPYFNIIPFKPFFDLGFNLYQNLNYIIVSLLFSVLTFYFIGMVANIFTDLLKERARELVSVKKSLEEEKATLEIKIEARTKELKELAESLDTQVKQRTKELQEKIGEL
ncbi:hypothetical protein KJA15_00770, partial [Patescibacteria group bacterium]|nr:hypothetical protein [Patescibacteria group bacterium]